MTEQRKKHNQDVLDRYRKGNSLSSFDPQLSFFPPRPIIKKDKKEQERVYGKGKSV